MLTSQWQQISPSLITHSHYGLAGLQHCQARSGLGICCHAPARAFAVVGYLPSQAIGDVLAVTETSRFTGTIRCFVPPFLDECYCSASAFSFVVHDSLLLSRRGWNCQLGTVDAADIASEELLLCCPLSPSWPVTHTQS